MTWAWIKDRWQWLAAGLGVALTFVAAIVFNRKREKIVTPSRPVLPDVEVSDKPVVDTTPSDTYVDKAKAVDAQVRDRVADANKRYP